MKRIPPDAVRAARSLGAGSVTAFRKVFLPQSLPGIIAGVVVVFTLALGYYVTPALVGGGADQLISTYIAFYINQSLNWGMAAALSLLLLGSLAAVLFAAYLAIRPAAVLGR
jgi:putative spermidine/putrescine transport system permease protein